MPFELIHCHFNGVWIILDHINIIGLLSIRKKVTELRYQLLKTWCEKSKEQNNAVKEILLIDLLNRCIVILMVSIINYIVFPFSNISCLYSIVFRYLIRGTCPIRTLNEQCYYARDVNLIHIIRLWLKIEMHYDFIYLR